MSICQISIWPPGTCLGIEIEAYGVWHTEANVAQEEYDRVLEEVKNTENWFISMTSLSNKMEKTMCCH